MYKNFKKRNEFFTQKLAELLAELREATSGHGRIILYGNLDLVSPRPLKTACKKPFCCLVQSVTYTLSQFFTQALSLVGHLTDDLDNNLLSSCSRWVGKAFTVKHEDLRPRVNQYSEKSVKLKEKQKLVKVK